MPGRIEAMPAVPRFAVCLWFFLGSLQPVAFAADSGFEVYRQSVRQNIEKQKEALRQDPENAEGHFKLGLSYQALGLHAEEIAAYQEAIRLQPDFAQAHFNLAITYDLLEDGTGAIRHMLKARQLYRLKRNHRQTRTAQRRLRLLFEKYDVDSKGENRP